MNIFSKKISETEQALITLQEQFDTLNEVYAKLEESFKELSETSNTYKEENFRLDTEIKELKEKNEAIESQIVEVIKDNLDIDELVSLKAVEILAQVGHPQVEVIEEALPEMDIVETFKSLKGKELQAFYNNPENKKVIKAAMNLK